MRTRTTILAVTAVAALSAACAVTVALAATAQAATVKLGHTSAGSLLETGSGFTLYQFSRDGRGRDRCATIAGCSAVWPALTVKGRPTAGAGIAAGKLGTISLGHGRRQVTYDGHPLYRYSGDSGPGETDYLNFSSFGGTWYGVSASGGRVR